MMKKSQHPLKCCDFELLDKLEFVNSAHEEIHITLAFSFSSPGRPDIL